MAVEPLHLVGNGFAQRQHAGHGRVLVQAVLHGAGDRIHQGRVAMEIGEALSQVDRAFFAGQCRHDGEDGSAHLGQLGDDVGGAHCSGLVLVMIASPLF